MAMATTFEISPRARQEARRALASYRSRVVHIGGVSRSGTTVLELLLADRLGAVSVGELRHVFERGIIGNQRCSCGEAFWDCHWWAPAAEAVFGPREKAFARATKVVEQQWSLVRKYPTVRNRRSPRLADFEAVVADLHTVLAEQAGGRWLIDSSKDPAWTEVVARTTDRSELVHLVRDPRGVVASNRRAVVRPEIVDREELMPRRGLVRTAAEWSVFNVLTASVRGVGRVPHRSLRGPVRRSAEGRRATAGRAGDRCHDPALARLPRRLGESGPLPDQRARLHDRVPR